MGNTLWLTAEEIDDKENLVTKQCYAPRIMKSFSKDVFHSTIYPNCMKLLNFFMIFPVSVACAAKLFSKLKTVKNCLRNRLIQFNIESSLMIATVSAQPFRNLVDDFKKRIQTRDYIIISIRVNYFRRM